MKSWGDIIGSSLSLSCGRGFTSDGAIVGSSLNVNSGSIRGRTLDASASGSIIGGTLEVYRSLAMKNNSTILFTGSSGTYFLSGDAVTHQVYFKPI